MTLEQFSGYLLLVMMSLLACLATRFISGHKYNGHGIYHITVNGLLRGNYVYKQWMKNNLVYYWCILLVITLCPTILSLAPSFRSGNMIVRPELMVWINPVLWAALLFSYRWFFNKMK